MDRITKGYIVSFSILVVISILLLIGPGATVPAWAKDSSVKWCAWADILKTLAPLAAFFFMFYQGYFGNILATVRSSVKLIAFGNLSLALGGFWETGMRMSGVDASAFSVASVFYIVGAGLVVWAMFAFPAKFGFVMVPVSRTIFVVLVVIASVGTLLLMILPYYITPNGMPTTYNFFDSLVTSAYGVSVLLILVAALRLALLFWTGRMGRPFRLIAIGAICIVVYEYYVWIPYTPPITLFHPINIFWFACYVFTCLGAFDLTLD